MATSDSEDFESADEELVAADDITSRKFSNQRQWQKPAASSTIGSDSDDDNECMPANTKNSTTPNSRNFSVQSSGQDRRRSRPKPTVTDDSHGAEHEKKTREPESEETRRNSVASQSKTKTCVDTSECLSLKEELEGEATKSASLLVEAPGDSVGRSAGNDASKREKQRRQKKAKEATGLGAKRLGSRTGVAPKPPAIEECWEFDEQETAKILKGLSNVERVKMPQELRSEKKFKEVFKTDGWEGLDDETILSELEDDRTKGVLAKITEAESCAWGGWGSWGVGSLINSASAGVSTLTSGVTHGLTLLDEAMGAPAPQDLAKDHAAENIGSNGEILEIIAFFFLPPT